MHWAQQRRYYRTIFGIASFLPAILIIAIAVWATKDPVMDRLRATVLRFCVAFGLTVVLQMGLAAIVGLHVDKRDDIPMVNKVLWIVGCGFFGSIFLPIFYFRQLRRYR